MNESWKIDRAKANCRIELCNVNEMYEVASKGVVLTSDPRTVIATKVFNKADLKLVVATQRIGFTLEDDVEEYPLVTIGPPLFPKELTFYCCKASALPTEDAAVGFVSMFWHVKPTHYKKDSNVDLVWEERQSADLNVKITVPIFISSKKINIGDVLYYHDTNTKIDNNAAKKAKTR